MKKPNKKRNPVARQLRHFTSKVFKVKNKYARKKYTKKTFTTEVVAGHCPECKEHTLLVGLKNTLFRCTTCGEDLEQKVNGVIKYLKPELAESVFNELAE